MIRVTGQRTVRETTAPYEYTDENGETVKEDIRVRYFVRTAKEAREDRENKLRQYEESKKKPDAPPVFFYHMDELAKRLESLPDLEDEKGKPFPITPDSLGMLTTANLEAINNAIEADIAPKEQPSK